MPLINLNLERKPPWPGYPTSHNVSTLPLIVTWLTSTLIYKFRFAYFKKRNKVSATLESDICRLFDTLVFTIQSYHFELNSRSEPGFRATWTASQKCRFSVRGKIPFVDRLLMPSMTTHMPNSKLRYLNTRSVGQAQTCSRRQRTYQTIPGKVITVN